MTSTDIANLALAKIGATLITSINSPSVKEAIHAKLHYDTARKQVLRDHGWQFANRTVELLRATPAASAAIYAKTPEIDGYWTEFAFVDGAPDFYEAADGALFEPAPVIDQDTGATVTRWVFVDSNDDTLAQADGDYTHPMAVLKWVDPSTYDEVSVAFRYSDAGAWSHVYQLPTDCVRPISLHAETGNKVDIFQRGSSLGGQVIMTHQAPSVFLKYTSDASDPDQFDPLFLDAFVTLLASKMARAITGSDNLESSLLSAYLTAILPEARFRDAQETAAGENRDHFEDIVSGDLLPRRVRTGVTVQNPPITAGGETPAPDLDGAFESEL